FLVLSSQTITCHLIACRYNVRQYPDALYDRISLLRMGIEPQTPGIPVKHSTIMAFVSCINNSLNLLAYLLVHYKQGY
ncbi:Uncharacterized protein APZ42_006306, partial [Daphnia magna]